MDTVASVPEDGEKIIEIQLERLRTFKNHPFKVRMDQEMIRLSASVEKYGIINPLIVRPIPDGVYEIISGHRRKAAAEKFGYRKVPVIIRVIQNFKWMICKAMYSANLNICCTFLTGHSQQFIYTGHLYFVCAFTLHFSIPPLQSSHMLSLLFHSGNGKRC